MIYYEDYGPEFVQQDYEDCWAMLDLDNIEDIENYQNNDNDDNED
jgi:hypothetical protein